MEFSFTAKDRKRYDNRKYNVFFFFFLHSSILVKEDLSLKLPRVIKADFLLAISIQNQTEK